MLTLTLYHGILFLMWSFFVMGVAANFADEQCADYKALINYVKDWSWKLMVAGSHGISLRREFMHFFRIHCRSKFKHSKWLS